MGRVAVAGLCSVVLVAGCSGGAFNGLNGAATQSSGSSAGARLTGTVHGGQQPIVGAHVYLLAAGTTGYGGAGVAPSSSNASVSLLTTGSGSDSVGEYVTTASDGSFSITGDYTCTAGQQVYLYALGGNPGAGANPAAGLMAALGNCPVAGVFPSSTFVMMNEVSTVAAAYAMAGFATNATHVGSSGTALAQVGIANAFANAGNLVDLTTGTALAITPAGAAPLQGMVNALADILAACVNSTGVVTGPTNPTPCYSLFSNALSGGSSGTLPSDTATSVINIAHNPGANAAALFGLIGASPPFPTTQSAPPSSWLVGIDYYAGIIANALAVDGSGNVWITSPLGSVQEFSSLGTVLSGAAGYTGGGISHPIAIAIDNSGNAWLTNVSNSVVSVVKLSSSGSPLSGVNGYTVFASSTDGPPPQGIAIDGSDNVWLANPAANNIVELSSSGTVLSGSNGYVGGGAFGYHTSIAIDGSDNAWVTNNSGNSVTEFTNSGTVLSGPSGYSVTTPGGIAIDSAGNAWVTTYDANTIANNVLTELSPSGATVLQTRANFANGIAIDGSDNIMISSSLPSGYACCSYFLKFSSAGTMLSSFPEGAGTGAVVDGSGDVWVSFSPLAGLMEYLGAGTPVVTPLAAGVKNNTLGTRP